MTSRVLWKFVRLELQIVFGQKRIEAMHSEIINFLRFL